MSSLFGPRRGRVKPPKRNRYDLSHQNLITTDFGLVKPFFCKEVIGGDSVSLNPVAAIRSHPIVFPVNTRIRGYFHYFYVRNRVLWKDWESFIFKSKEGLVPPYLQLSAERAKKMISTGSLGDCLGVPSTIGVSETIAGSVNINRTGAFVLPKLVSANINGIKSAYSSMIGQDIRQPDGSGLRAGLGFWSDECFSTISKSDLFSSFPFNSSQDNFSTDAAFILFTDKDYKAIDLSSFSLVDLVPVISILYQGTSSEDGFTVFIDTTVEGQLYELTSYLLEKYGSYRFFIGTYEIPTAQTAKSYFPLPSQSSSLNIPAQFPLLAVVEGIHDATEDDYIRFNKFVGDSPVIPLSALPFRACEMIANYFFRNDQNNPYILNGEPQYNQFIPSVDGGPDTNEYVLHHRNWEFDQYTSAVPSPQFGAAPLVGVTYSGGNEAELKFQGTDSDGVTQDYSVKVGLADDGVIQSVIDFDKGIPSGSLRSLIDLSSVGISINDLRNVNSYQRFKENCLRRSLRYRDQMLSHLGVSVDYPDIDVPQFIGGFSGDLVVTPVTNMSESNNAMLGDVAGKIESVIKSNHRITCYCPEHGFIIGMFSLVPIPTYSQLLPKMFTRLDAFDYFQSEFGKIGYVPIFHKELFPLQSADPDKTFGYQRAWYEYMSSNDEVHGDFRTSLSDFVLYRQFKDEPTLNEDFTTIHSDSLNNIFAVDKVAEKYKNSEHFMVQFYHDAVFKRPIPKYGMPSLE